jgi:hypothetical protein
MWFLGREERDSLGVGKARDVAALLSIKDSVRQMVGVIRRAEVWQELYQLVEVLQRKVDQR